jgi:hypothetical protein
MIVDFLWYGINCNQSTIPAFDLVGKFVNLSYFCYLFIKFYGLKDKLLNKAVTEIFGNEAVLLLLTPPSHSAADKTSDFNIPCSLFVIHGRMSNVR